jgi:hypothetical protein
MPLGAVTCDTNAVDDTRTSGKRWRTLPVCGSCFFQQLHVAGVAGRPAGNPRRSVRTALAFCDETAPSHQNTITLDLAYG